MDSGQRLEKLTDLGPAGKVNRFGTKSSKSYWMALRPECKKKMDLCPALDLRPEAGKVREVGPTLMGLGPEAAKLMDYI
jgi:hypothetical protein